ncbi:AraD1 family protein [Vreelandella neptunia]|uniref:FAH family protein n=1 Tax=Vreelandella neptunia TaxID=115551 RepID=A0ABS9SBZ9_9GAMM|nr:AraD1 family protein [Halomonas neptunia]MCH4813641.1 FAH family protein [Halomonas neptunia]
MHIVQVENNGNEVVAAVVNGDELELLSQPLYTIALQAANSGNKLVESLADFRTSDIMSYDTAIRDGRLRAPITHPEPANLLLTGTGLTHLGSAAPRSQMHAAEKAEPKTAQPTDTQRMFDLGVAGGKPTSDEVGAQPEWFYKGTGHTLRAPFAEITMPDFALDGGEEAELAGIYIVNDEGRIYRVGFSLANEFSDHVTEKQNYLYLAHSKLRDCSIGPEIFVGDLPEEVEGSVSLHRNGDQLWQRAFMSGEKHMCHSVSNLEYHHFKYATFCQPNQLHIHFFGAAVLSFGDGIALEDGDEMRIECDIMTRPLSNVLKRTPAAKPTIETL